MALLLAGMLFLSVTADDVRDLAVEASVDPVDLAGAVNTTGLEPREYLYAVGHLQRPRPVAPQIPYGVWDQLADCESDGRWWIDAYHDGGLQFLPSTWTSYKPRGYPAYAFLATREQQIRVARMVLAEQGWKAWPACSRRLGLR